MNIVIFTTFMFWKTAGLSLVGLGIGPDMDPGSIPGSISGVPANERQEDILHNFPNDFIGKWSEGHQYFVTSQIKW